MERVTRFFVTVLIVLTTVLGKQMYIVNGDSPYACWGGCYNKCILLNMRARVQQTNPCYLRCLSKCIPRSTSEYQDYCSIGCSLELCIPTRYDAGADLDACFGSCGNICRAN
ncbi:hypothetical protein P3S68_011233 [Capsicum galapagoense]